MDRSSLLRRPGSVRRKISSILHTDRGMEVSVPVWPHLHLRILGKQLLIFLLELLERLSRGCIDHVFYSQRFSWTVQGLLPIHLSAFVREEFFQFSEEVFECFVRGPIEVLMRVLKKPHNSQLVDIWVDAHLKSIDLCHLINGGHVLV